MSKRLDKDEDHNTRRKKIDVMEPLRALRGIGKEVFRELGGGEQFLREERDRFRASTNEERAR